MRLDLPCKLTFARLRYIAVERPLRGGGGTPALSAVATAWADRRLRYGLGDRPVWPEDACMGSEGDRPAGRGMVSGPPSRGAVRNPPGPGAVPDAPDLDARIADLDRHIQVLSCPMDQHADAPEMPVYLKLMDLYGQLTSRLGRLMRDRRQIVEDEGPATELSRAVDHALDQLSVEWGLDL